MYRTDSEYTMMMYKIFQNTWRTLVLVLLLSSQVAQAVCRPEEAESENPPQGSVSASAITVSDGAVVVGMEQIHIFNPDSKKVAKKPQKAPYRPVYGGG